MIVPGLYYVLKVSFYDWNMGFTHFEHRSKHIGRIQEVSESWNDRLKRSRPILSVQGHNNGLNMGLAHFKHRSNHIGRAFKKCLKAEMNVPAVPMIVPGLYYASKVIIMVGMWVRPILNNYI